MQLLRDKVYESIQNLTDERDTYQHGTLAWSLKDSLLQSYIDHVAKKHRVNAYDVRDSFVRWTMRRSGGMR